MSRLARGPKPREDGGPSLTPWLRLALVAGLVVSLAAGLALGLRSVFPGLGRPEPGSERIAPGVCLEAGGKRVEVGGLRGFEAAGLLEETAGDLSRLPKDSYIDPSTKGLVPGVSGRRLDVAATVASAVAARSGQAIEPIFYVVPPLLGLEDFPEAPIYHGNEAKNEVAIILNVAWGDEFLDDICALVEKAGGKLTICPIGLWLEGNGGRVSWLGEAASRGHEIGNHGYYNRPMVYGDAAKLREELIRTSTLIHGACGKHPVFFAPPMGEFDEATLAGAAAEGCRTVLWSLDTIDWRLEGVDVIAKRVISRVKAGDIILCHPTEQTGPAMEEFLPVLAEKGLRIVTLSELLSPDLPPDAGAGPLTGAP